MLPEVWRLAQAQNKIEWENFIEGAEIPQLRIYDTDSRLLAQRIRRGKLLETTHVQWIFCCIIKHHRTKAIIALTDKWMLEVDVQQVVSYILADNQYWIHAVEVVRQAGTCAAKLSEGVTNKWDNIVRDRHFKHLSKPTPIPTERSTNIEQLPRGTQTSQAKNRKKQPHSLLSSGWHIRNSLIKEQLVSTP